MSKRAYMGIFVISFCRYQFLYRVKDRTRSHKLRQQTRYQFLIFYEEGQKKKKKKRTQIKNETKLATTLIKQKKKKENKLHTCLELLVLSVKQHFSL